ncbi:MAG: arylesterase [Acidobacteria bacterium]|nr:arylesterase [Acidobacteriota bacterium]|tara:strand:+ start:2003 stop:2719 length:717 start_codon:yes stop_codon:yes gene_type:complete
MVVHLKPWLVGFVIGVSLACGSARENPSKNRQDSTDPQLFENGSSGVSLEEPLIVVLGDSLTAGLGLDVEQTFPFLLEERLQKDGYAVTVVNAGVSGDTTAGGLSRVGWALEGDVRILVLALGGNDGLRGLSVEQMKRNLSEILAEAKGRGMAVLLAGMEAPPNFGLTYAAEFREAFRELAEAYDVAFLPFLLAGVATEPSLNQADGIHPNVDGSEIVAQNVHEALTPLLPALDSVLP